MNQKILTKQNKNKKTNKKKNQNKKQNKTKQKQKQKQKQAGISKISVVSNFMFTSYAWLLYRLLYK